MNTEVDTYLIDGCGRCALGGTPECKVNSWQKELQQLRQIILSCGLDEGIKWGVPCYTFNNSNVVMMSAFKAYCALSFFKGVLLKDQQGLLQKPGENSQAVRLFKFTDVIQILELEAIIKEYIHEAIEIEKAGLKIDFNEKHELQYPEELLMKLNEKPELKAAFEALTPGRQRGYVLYFTATKQSKTRESRIEKCIPLIFEGKGLNGR